MKRPLCPSDPHVSYTSKYGHLQSPKKQNPRWWWCDAKLQVLKDKRPISSNFHVQMDDRYFQSLGEIHTSSSTTGIRMVTHGTCRTKKGKTQSIWWLKGWTLVITTGACVSFYSDLECNSCTRGSVSSQIRSTLTLRFLQPRSLCGMETSPEVHVPLSLITK